MPAVYHQNTHTMTLIWLFEAYFIFITSLPILYRLRTSFLGEEFRADNAGGAGEGGVGEDGVGGCQKSERIEDILDVQVSYCFDKLRHSHIETKKQKWNDKIQSKKRSNMNMNSNSSCKFPVIPVIPQAQQLYNFQIQTYFTLLYFTLI